jgi:hypothetical protein
MDETRKDCLVWPCLLSLQIVTGSARFPFMTVGPSDLYASSRHFDLMVVGTSELPPDLLDPEFAPAEAAAHV